MPLKNKEAQKAYYEKNKEARAAWNKAYRAKNKDRIKAYEKAYNEENKEAKRVYNKAYRAKNKDRIKAYLKAYNEENKEAKQAYDKAYHVLRKHGITLEEKERMKQEQENKCKICHQDFLADVEPHVDHCHTTGEIRGLLCQGCNIGLGQFKDNPVALAKAIEYLKEVGNV